MKVLIEYVHGEKEVVTVKGSLREFLNKQYNSNYVCSLSFYKSKHGANVHVADVSFYSPYSITLHFQWLTETEQRQFIGFISDNVTTSVYGCPFNLEFSSR